MKTGTNMARHLNFTGLISSTIRNILGGIILFSSLLLFLNVILRYIFLAPIFWADELARYLMVWLIFLGAGILAEKSQHISVDAMSHVLPSRVVRVMNRLICLINALFSVCLAYYGLQHALHVRQSEQVTAALDWPMWLAYMAIPVGATLMAIFYFQQFFTRGGSEQ